VIETAATPFRFFMNTKDLLRIGVPLGETSRRATDFVAKFILGGGDNTHLQGEGKRKCSL
jgi:hypothetical protein